jgi:hypothetical protein
MALVKVRWEVTETHEKEFEVDGYDPNAGFDDADLDDLVCSVEGGKTFVATTDRTVLQVTVVRDGDEPFKVTQTAPKYEPEWDDDDDEGTVTGLPPVPTPHATDDEHADFHRRSLLPMPSALCEQCTPREA